MQNTALSFFVNKGQITESLTRKIEQKTSLVNEITELRRRVDIAERISEVWDDVPIEIIAPETNHLITQQSLDESGVWYRRAIISRDKGSEDITKPIYWRLEINEFEVGAANDEKWFLGKKLEIDLKSYEEALEIVREWILDGTIRGEEVEG